MMGFYWSYYLAWLLFIVVHYKIRCRLISPDAKEKERYINYVETVKNEEIFVTEKNVYRDVRIHFLNKKVKENGDVRYIYSIESVDFELDHQLEYDPEALYTAKITTLKLRFPVDEYKLGEDVISSWCWRDCQIDDERDSEARNKYVEYRIPVLDLNISNGSDVKDSLIEESKECLRNRISKVAEEQVFGNDEKEDLAGMSFIVAVLSILCFIK